MVRGDRRLPPAYPLLLAVAPTLEIAARSAGQYRSSDLATVLAAIGLLTGIVLIALFAVLRRFDRDRAGPLAGILTALVVGWCFYYLPTRAALASAAPRLGSHAILLPVGLVATTAAVWWLVRRPVARLRAPSAFLSRFAFVLVALVAWRAAAAEERRPRLVRRSEVVRELSAPVRTFGPVVPDRNTPPRDIYLIVLDGQANGRVLQEVFGYDNTSFEDSLRALGFVVPRDVRSNYVQTYLSVASLLNAAHLTGLASDAGVASKDHSLPTYLVQHNRAARFLREQGYEYVLFPSAWWAATSSSPLADRTFDPQPGFDPVAAAHRTELRLAVLRSSLLGLAFPSAPAELPVVQHILRSFEGLREVPADPDPTFAFAHVLIPHDPYVLDGRCAPLAEPISEREAADTPEQRAAYIAQVRCAERLVLDLVTELLRRSANPPLILVVGDHGPAFADVGFYAHPERVPAAFVRQRLGAFGAFHLPAGGESGLREPVTLVNVLGHVLRYYFGADLPPSPDAMYVSGEYLYRFHPVDPRLLDRRPGASEPAVAER